MAVQLSIGSGVESAQLAKIWWRTASLVEHGREAGLSVLWVGVRGPDRTKGIPSIAPREKCYSGLAALYGIFMYVSPRASSLSICSSRRKRVSSRRARAIQAK